MKKIIKALTACALAFAIILSPIMGGRVFALTVRHANIPDSGTMSIAQLQQEFPRGAYWNHANKDEENPNPYEMTDTPCNHNNNYNGWFGFDRCNSFGVSNVGGVQCAGFSTLMSYLYSFGRSINPENIEEVYIYDINDVQVGDVIRANDHSVFVAEVLGGGSFKVGEANYGHTCSINWGRVVDTKRFEYFEVTRLVRVGAYEDVINSAEEDYDTVFRFYNPRTGSHAFTTAYSEFINYIKTGWEKEKSVGKEVNSDGVPVYELMNKTTGELLYTSDKNEYDTLNGNGWDDRHFGYPVINSPVNGKKPVYRLNKPGSSGPTSHHYTSDKKEIEILIRDHGYVYDNGGNPIFTLN